MNLKEIIIKCNKCGNLEKLTCDSTKKGSSRILVLGESPAKDGWIVTGKPFYNKEGNLQASGKILDKNTHYYLYLKNGDPSEKKHAIKDVMERNYYNHIYVSKSNKAYQQINFEQLKNL